VEHSAASSLVVVRFTEIGAAAVLSDRLDLLYNRTLPLDSVLPRQTIEEVQNSSVRFSLSKQTTIEDVDFTIWQVSEALDKLRSAPRRPSKQRGVSLSQNV
jgi:uncharacterized protein (DUF927 family)